MSLNKIYAKQINGIKQFIFSLYVGCEKSFSTLSFIKNLLRNRLSMENLDTWIMHLNKDILETVTHENIIEEVTKHSSVFKKMYLKNKQLMTKTNLVPLTSNTWLVKKSRAARLVIYDNIPIITPMHFPILSCRLSV
ncbi:Zinc finger MYM-type protein 1 [Aphis craccivora]|uniref:Zinc finger MYM-type protein 1 n=1 Tax=Aphis craccivora TaxID=307492 RepID=A0A6G0Y335_APHCR|nr:Zinc finger MYM-type protein 1 [Aphis craccivora]